MMVLVGLVMVSGVSVAFVKYESRQLFTEKEKLRTYRDELANEWMLLQVELATRAMHDRIERDAVTRLQMQMPQQNDIRVLYVK